MDASDMELMPSDGQMSGVSPRRIFLDVGPGAAHATLIAATEGEARFVASAPGEPGPPAAQAASALRLLAAQCGYPLTAEMIDGAIVRGAPLRIGLVGVRSAADETAISHAERSGIAQIAEVTAAPPRNAGGRLEWARPVLDAYRRGEYDALMIVILPGALPMWAAQLLNGLHASARYAAPDLLVIASEAALAPALPAGARLFVRGPSLPHELAETLTAMLSQRITAGSAPTAPLLSHTAALSAGITFVARALRETVIYMDVSIGTTVLIAREGDVDIIGDGGIDCAAGAVTLLDRVGAEQVARWVPFPIDADAMRRWAVRRVSRPAATSVEASDRAVAAGFARAALGAVTANVSAPLADSARCIIGPGVLAWSTPLEAISLVADSLRGVRIANVATDPDDLLPIVGALAAPAPECAQSLLTHDLLSGIGAVLTLPANAQRRDATIVAIGSDGDRAARVAIAANAITRLPLPPTGALRATYRDGREEILAVSGRAGVLLVDTRTRPLTRIGVPDAPRANVSARLRPALASEEAPHG